eukprot:g61532.t1
MHGGRWPGHRLSRRESELNVGSEFRGSASRGRPAIIHVVSHCQGCNLGAAHTVTGQLSRFECSIFAKRLATVGDRCAGKHQQCNDYPYIVYFERTRPQEPGRAIEPAPINQDDIARTKILLDGLVVCALDKNPNSLWVECPVLTYCRMEKEVVRAPCFMPCNRKPEDILDEYFHLYISRDLKRFGKLARKLTRLPKGQRSPWRYVLRNLGRILTFVVLEFSKHCVNFNLNDLSKVQELLHRAMARFRAQDGTAHLFASSPLCSRYASSKLMDVVTDDRVAESRLSKSRENRGPWQEGHRNIKSDVIALVQLDLDHAHFTMGNGVFMQLHGRAYQPYCLYPETASEIVLWQPAESSISLTSLSSYNTQQNITNGALSARRAPTLIEALQRAAQG